MQNLKRSTLSEQIYDILKDDIITKEILPGTKLTLKSLQERFDVSSTPIREALTRLSEDDLVVYYSNVGVKVIELTEKDLDELFEFMGDLDSLAIRYAFESNDKDTILDELRINLDISKAAMGKPDFHNWNQSSDKFHLIFYNYCNNKRLCAAANKMRGQMTILSNSYERFPEYQNNIENDHVDIYEALLNNDIQLAQEKMRDHLMNCLKFAKNFI
jgi:DNA-binding GntR family transcriptional regulator